MENVDFEAIHQLSLSELTGVHSFAVQQLGYYQKAAIAPVPHTPMANDELLRIGMLGAYYEALVDSCNSELTARLFALTGSPLKR